MAIKSCSKTTRICAMCKNWNGHLGGEKVKPRIGMRNTWEYESDEAQTCYLHHLSKKAWQSCASWIGRQS